MRVLIVEDDILLGKQYGRLLSSEGMDCEVVMHAIDAINSIDDDMPDVIVLDMLLVGSTAVTLLHELQSHGDTARIPVVMVTSVADILTLDQMKEYGVVRMLDKATMHPDDLTSAIRAVV